MHKQQGFTLIELLISVTLLSLIMFTGNYVYMQLASRWDKELGSFEQDIEQTKSIYILQNILEGIEPYLIKNNRGRPEMFFVGGEDSLLMMTKNGYTDTKNPELVRLTAVQNQQGHFELVYQSISSADMLLINSEQNIEFSNKYTLLKDLDSVTFSYYGWGSLEQKALQEPGERPFWQSTYSGLDQQLTPLVIKLTLVKKQQPMEFYFQLDKDPNRWFGNYIQTGEL